MSGGVPRGERRGLAPGVVLFLCLLAAQSGVLVLSPILEDVADEFHVSTATAGQLRSFSGIVAGLAAVLMARVAKRFGLRDTIGVGLALLGAGSLVSAIAPSFAVLATGQVLIGLSLAIVLSAGVAAAGEWSTPENRSRTLAWSLVGPPSAWILGLPIVAVVASKDWRYAWLALPLAASVIAAAALRTRPPDRTEITSGIGWRILQDREVLAWSIGELLAFSAWAGTLTYAGALFVEAHGNSTSATAIYLAIGAAFYLPGNFLARRWIGTASRTLLIGCALAASVLVALYGAVRPSTAVSLVFFSALSFVAGGRTLAGSAFGLDSSPSHKVAVMSVRTAALQFGYPIGAAAGGAALAAAGYSALGATLSGLFVLAVIPHAAMLLSRRGKRVDVEACEPELSQAPAMH